MQQRSIQIRFRRAARLGVRGAVLAMSACLAFSATAARADVPEGWSDPEEVDLLQALILLGGLPLLLFVLITLAVYLPAMIRGERLGPQQGQPEAIWFGGPRKGTRELASPEDASPQSGGARGRW